MINALKYLDYTATITYSADDEVFFGKVVGLNDLLLFEGTSVTELKQAFAQTIDDYLETCKHLGKSPDKAYKGSFNVRVPVSLHKQVATIASQHHVTLNDFVKTALKHAVENGVPFSFADEQADYKLKTQ